MDFVSRLLHGHQNWGYVGCPLTPTCTYICTRGFPTLFSSTDGPKPPTNMAMKPLLNIGSSESNRGTQFHFSAHQHYKTQLQLPSNRVGTSGKKRAGTSSALVSFKANPIMSILQKRIPKQIQRGSEPGQNFRIVKSQIWGP
jgi:hypothetical protein